MSDSVEDLQKQIDGMNEGLVLSQSVLIFYLRIFKDDPNMSATSSKKSYNSYPRQQVIRY